MRRFDMRLPAIVKVADASVDELLTETQNVSARGVFSTSTGRSPPARIFR